MTRYHDPQALAEIIRMSRWVGEPRRDLVILAEGNTSLAVGNRLLVKASGASLQEAAEPDFVEVDPGPIADVIARGTADDEDVARVLRSATTWGERHPSVETLLHVVCQALEPVEAVIHSHPTPVNAMLCSTEAAALVDTSYFPDQIVTLGRNPLLIPYIDPGLTLAHRAQAIIAEHISATGAPPKAVYLQNHGLFALGGSVAEAQQITDMAVKTARIVLGALSVGGAVGLSRSHAERIDTRPDELHRRRLISRSRVGE